ncbi:MAG: LysR family transcriptional regulator [Clostridia bacterium]|nr:LysR family transcriptional regulator [Clostridia bacterium]
MELLQLVYFCEAAKHENFSTAAKHFYIPTSAISQSIRRLESELSVPLFYRGGNRVKLSDEGKLFYDSAKKALATLEDARLRLRELHDGVCGEIKLFIGNNRRTVVSVIEQYRKKYPAVSFLLNHSEVSDPAEYDLLISGDMLRYAEMEKQLLVREKLLLAIPAAHSLAQKKDLMLYDCKDECFVSMHPGSSLRTVTEEVCKKVGFLPNFAVQSDDPVYIRKYIELGMGVSLIPSFSWKGQLSSQVVLRDVGEFYRETYLMSHPSVQKPKCVTLFAEMLAIAFTSEAEM